MVNPTEILRDNLSKALSFWIESGKAQLKKQGHRSSGRLEDSFEAKIKLVGDTFIASVLTDDYGTYLDKGVKKNRIRYSPEVLKPWARRIMPALSEKGINSFVWAVYITHKKKGMPTSESSRFSSTGKRTGWVEATVKKHQSEFDEIVNLGQYMQLLIDNTLEDIIRQSR